MNAGFEVWTVVEVEVEVWTVVEVEALTNYKNRFTNHLPPQQLFHIKANLRDNKC